MIAIIDYGVGNLFSLVSSLRMIGADAIVTGDAEEIRALNEALIALRRATRTGALARRNRVIARAEFFEVCADPHHEGYGRLGLYHVETGVVQRVDTVARTLTIEKRIIPFSDIRRLSTPGGEPFRLP